MVGDLLSALIALLVALGVAFGLGGSLRRYPAVFYAVALVFSGAYVWCKLSGTYAASLQVVVDVMGKGFLACAFLAIVMYTGVLDEGSPARKRLQPIRAELSIISFILILGHVVGYAPSYLTRLGVVFGSKPSLAVSFTVALVLLVVFALLSVLSLAVVRRRMPYRLWKRIQRLSYAMVGLLYLHIVLVLARSAFMGHPSVSAQVALGVYTLAVAVYAVLRVRKALRDRRRAERPVAEGGSVEGVVFEG